MSRVFPFYFVLHAPALGHPEQLQPHEERCARLSRMILTVTTVMIARMTAPTRIVARLATMNSSTRRHRPSNSALADVFVFTHEQIEHQSEYQQCRGRTAGENARYDQGAELIHH